jgi:hypothetical protein
MKINGDLVEILYKFKIPYEEGLCGLLALYYNCVPMYMPQLLIQKLYATGIVVKNLDNTLTWRVPLFDKQEVNFAWVVDYRNVFKKINSDRAGSLNTCVLRMKKFFSENPHVRVDDVKGALGMYIRTVKDPQYLITSHKFIYDGAGTSRNSHLEEWIEKYRESQGLERKSQSKIMQ